MKTKRIIVSLIVLMAAALLVGCSSQQHFGQRKAPKGCNTCTKWNR